jgi:hypothetical protein
MLAGKPELRSVMEVAVRLQQVDSQHAGTIEVVAVLLPMLRPALRQWSGMHQAPASWHIVLDMSCALALGAAQLACH